MIDVRFTAAHGLWIFGAALLLATVSYCRWLAAHHDSAMLETIQRSRAAKRSLAAGVACMAAGIAWRIAA